MHEFLMGSLLGLAIGSVIASLLILKYAQKSTIEMVIKSIVLHPALNREMILQGLENALKRL